MIYTSDIKGYLDLFGTHTLTIFGVLRGAPFTGPGGREFGSNAVLEVGTGRVDHVEVQKKCLEVPDSRSEEL